MVRVLIIGTRFYQKGNCSNDLIDSSDKIIACDGAVERCLDASINVDYVVGDMDSLENTTLAELSKMGIEVQNWMIKIIMIYKKQSISVVKLVLIGLILLVSKVAVTNINLLLLVLI